MKKGGGIGGLKKTIIKPKIGAPATAKTEDPPKEPEVVAAPEPEKTPSPVAKPMLKKTVIT